MRRYAIVSLQLLLGLIPIMNASLMAAELPALKHRFVVVCHRGNHTHTHENSLAAFEAAIRAGADFVELDVRRTRDGRYVLLHDSTVNRTTDGHGRLTDYTFNEVRRLSLRDPHRPGLAPGRIPTLQEALQTCRDRIHVYLDFKEGDRAEVARILHAEGVARQVVVYDDIGRIAEWRRVAPKLPVIVSPPAEAAADPAKLTAFIAQYHPEVLDGDAADYRPAAVEAALKAGCAVWPDIQATNEGPAYWSQVLLPGFGGAQTDHPDTFIRWLHDEGRR